MNQEEKDKIIRQKLENFAPPMLPNSTWQPPQTWRKIAPQLTSKPKTKVLSLQRVIYRSIAASILLLLGVWAAFMVNTAQENNTLAQDKKPENSLKEKIAVQKFTHQTYQNKTNWLAQEDAEEAVELENKQMAIYKKPENSSKIRSNDTKTQKPQKQTSKIQILENQPVELTEIQQDFEIIEEISPTTLAAQTTAKETKPQEIILLVSEDAQKKKIGLFVGRKNKSQATETNKITNKNKIRLNKSTDDGFRSNALSAEVALLKVKLK